MRDGLYWKEEEKRKYRVCGGEEETWEHMWERCGKMWEEGIEKGKVGKR